MRDPKDPFHILVQPACLQWMKLNVCLETTVLTVFFLTKGGESTFHPGYLDILKHLADDVKNTNYTSIHMTSNCSRPMKWFETYVEYAKPFHRASITASLHVEHVNTKEKMQEFADKLIRGQEHDVQITINQVMVPEHFERDWENALFFHEQGINPLPTEAQFDPLRPKSG